MEKKDEKKIDFYPTQTKEDTIQMEKQDDKQIDETAKTKEEL